MVDPSLFSCKWDKYKDVIDYWNEYTVIVKRGNSPLIHCPVYMYDVAECELRAEGIISKKKKEREEAKAMLKGLGVMK